MNSNANPRANTTVSIDVEKRRSDGGGVDIGATLKPLVSPFNGS